MKYKLIPAHELQDSKRIANSLERIESGINALAAEGWRVVAILDGHIFVLEQPAAPGECDRCGCAISTYGGGTRCISCSS